MVLSRFDLFETRGEARKLAPYLVVLSSELLDALNSCVIAPVRKADRHGPLRRRLHVPVQHDDAALIVTVEELASVPRATLGKRVGSLAAYRDALVSALDFLFQGY